MEINLDFGAVFLVPVAAWLLVWGTALGMARSGSCRSRHPLTLLDDAGHHSRKEEEPT